MPVARLNGIEINYEVHGEGTPLVLAHGYTASLEMWGDQVPAWSKKYRVVAYDTRGHGKTTAPADMSAYTLAGHYVPDQLALMDHLGIDTAYVGGLSMGGMIAQEFALRHPERVKALLLLDTGPGIGGAMRNPAMQERFGKMREMFQTVARTKGMSAIIESMRESPIAFRAMSGAPVPDGVRRHIEGMRRMSVDGLLGAGAALQQWSGSLDRLHEIRVPALVLVGDQDNLLEPSRIMHGKIAGSRFVLIRDSGHGTSVWRPEACAKGVVDFLADVDAGKPVAGEFVL
ncbi:MAG: alpha/beta fold hydrolase [Dehalococcoidia bacterium]